MIRGTHGYLLKLERAALELDALNTDIKRWVENDFHAGPGASELNLDGKTWNPIPWLGLNEPDMMWGVRIGEVVHNLHSALDHLATNLVIFNTKDPKSGRDTMFPILGEEGNWTAQIDQRNRETDKKSPIAGVSEAAYALIKDAQPFNPWKKGQNDPLFKLHRLNLIDKHRSLHVAKVTAETADNFRMSPPGYHTVVAVKWPKMPYVIDQDAKMADVKIALVSPPPPDVKMGVGATIETDVWFGEIGKAPIATLKTLGEAHIEVARICAEGMKLLPPPD